MNEIVEDMLKHLDEDQREDFEERAAIMEYDAKMPRDHAECLALLYLIKKYPAALLPSYMKGNTSQGERHE